MREFLHQLKLIIYTTPSAKLWLLAALVMAALAVWSLRQRRSAPGLAAAFLFAAACGLAFNLQLFLVESQSVPWRKLMAKDLPSLTLTSLELPRTGYMFGNEPYLFLNDYLRGKQLVVPQGPAAQFFANQCWQVISPPRTGSEFVFSDQIRGNFPDHLDQEQVSQILKWPHFGIGEPGKNFAIFVLGEPYHSSQRVYLYHDGRQYYFIPAALAPARG